jgi:oligoxyloglucan reducing-end-specific cellobiohydrolase
MKLFRFSFLLAVVPLCASAGTLAPTSTWAYQAQFMEEGDLFDSTYTATANEYVSVTAWNAVSDQFGIYINGTLQLNSSVVPDWDALGMLSAVPDQTFNSFDEVFFSGLYSTATFDVQKGDVIWIQLTHLAPDDGVIYSDGDFGTVAIEGAVPEPATLGLAGLALLGIGLVGRRRSANSRKKGPTMSRNCLRGAIAIAAVLCLAQVSAFAQLPPPTPTAQTYAFNPVTIMAGGYIPNIVAHPTEKGLFYVRTDMGGAYRWDTVLLKWIPLLDFTDASHYSNYLGPESIALDPNDPNKLYIATGMYTGNQAYLLYSENRGTTFEFYPFPSPVATTLASNSNGRSEGERLAVNPFNASELFFATRKNGLWKSENHGQTWSQVTTFPIISTSDPGLGFVLFDRFHSGRVFVGNLVSGGLYQSLDDGATWALVPGQPSGNFAVGTGTRKPQRAVINLNGILYLTLGDQAGPNNMLNGEVWKLDTNTAAWTNITPAGAIPGTQGGFIGIDVDAQQPNTVVTATFDRWGPIDTIYLSRDAGATWKDLGWLANYQPSSIAKSPWLAWGGVPKYGWWMSALLIDPTDSNHLMYATGATIFATHDLADADAATQQGQGPYWDVEAQGVEECAVLALISPTAGAHVLSGTGDVGGFRHDDFTTSPSTMMTNPIFGNGTGLDWAGQNASFIVRTGNTAPNGAYSTDGGTTWTPFVTTLSSTSLKVAVSADASVIYLSNRQYSLDNGTTITSTPTTGTGSLPSSSISAIFADKVRPKVFYAFQSSTGNFYSTYKSDGTEDGHTWTVMNGASNLPHSSAGLIVPVYNIAGDIWLTQSTALYRSTDFGATWTKVNASGNAAKLTNLTTVAVGAPKTAAAYPSIFVYGTYNGIQGIFRSDTKGSSWIRISDDLHNYGGPDSAPTFVGDPRVYGRIYMGMNGRGIIYGDIAHAAQ